jgi:hypothetical protein
MGNLQKPIKCARCTQFLVNFFMIIEFQQLYILSCIHYTTDGMVLIRDQQGDDIATALLTMNRHGYKTLFQALSNAGK